MRNLKVSAIIVTYKSANLVIDCLRSVASERKFAFLDVRVVVVDNASGDLPLIESAVNRYGWRSWVDLVEAPKNGGFAYGNNLGLRYARNKSTPDYLYLLNPDTQVRPGAIIALTEFLERHPDVGIAGSSFENLDGSIWPIAFRFPSVWSEVIDGIGSRFVSHFLRRWSVSRSMSEIEQRVDWICGASMMIRPTVFQTIGGLDDNYFLYFEETDFCYRAWRAGFPTWYVPRSRVMHIMGQSTNVINSDGAPQRLPGYWFESRTRYFTIHFGLVYACLIDLVAIIANSVGLTKRKILGRNRTAPLCYIRDLIQHSVLRPKNRKYRHPRPFQRETS